MSVEPPSSGRPTGPPSGPLSGPSGPPPGPPSQPPGGGDGQGGEPHRPWWRSAPRVATLTTAVVVAAALALVLTRSGDSSGKRGEVFLQAANSSGQDPFTESTAQKSSAAPLSAAPAASAASANEVRGVDGGAPGLYSGTKNSASCDVEQQVKYFQAAPSRNRAFASQVGVQPSGVPAYLRSLTPVQLRADTRVTAHGYRDGKATTYQSVLQTGTAVLVDEHGVPRLRCACGNPLAPPVAQRTTPRTTGTAWAAYRPASVVVVAPAAQIIKVFVVFDHEHDDWFGRHRGDHTGHHDRPARPPADPDPINPPGHHGCLPASGKPGSPGTTPCPPVPSGPSTPASPGHGSKSPSVNSPSSNSPSSKPSQSPSGKPASKPPSSEPPSSQPPSSQSPASKPPSAEPPSSQPPKSESPNSEPPSNGNESPRTESPKNESPASQPPASQGPVSQGPPSSAQQPGPLSPASPGPESALSPVAPESPAQQAPPGSAGAGSPGV
ncbi:DUF6777 domain-containing protein [Streptomyces sp. NPDC001980]|uniref:DUF6777 domain-containing protein n=1 Tax=Streptomyces sp. NPDC001980 TaxID=3157126 RepID=UPI00331C267D